MHQSLQALWGGVVALYAFQEGGTRIQFLLHVCCPVPEYLTQSWPCPI